MWKLHFRHQKLRFSVLSRDTLICGQESGKPLILWLADAPYQLHQSQTEGSKIYMNI